MESTFVKLPSLDIFKNSKLNVRLVKSFNSKTDNLKFNLGISPGVAPQQYNHEKKISMNLSLTELGQMLVFFKGQGEKLSFIHKQDPKVKESDSKYLNFTRATDKKGVEGIWLNISTSVNPSEKIAIFLASEDQMVLSLFIQEAILSIAGFENGTEK